MKEILQDIIQVLRMRRDQASSNLKERAPGVYAQGSWSDYWLGVSVGYNSAITLIKEYVKNEKGIEDDKK